MKRLIASALLVCVFAVPAWADLSKSSSADSSAAAAIRQLGQDMLMLTSVEDLAVFRPVAEVLGDKFFFVASPSQVYDALPDSPMKSEITKFLVPWKA